MSQFNIQYYSLNEPEIRMLRFRSRLNDLDFNFDCEPNRKLFKIWQIYCWGRRVPLSTSPQTTRAKVVCRRGNRLVTSGLNHRIVFFIRGIFSNWEQARKTNIAFLRLRIRVYLGKEHLQASVQFFKHWRNSWPFIVAQLNRSKLFKREGRGTSGVAWNLVALGPIQVGGPL